MLDEKTSQKPVPLHDSRPDRQTDIRNELGDAGQLGPADHGPLRGLADGIEREVFEVAAPFRDLQRQLGLVPGIDITANIGAITFSSSLPRVFAGCRTSERDLTAWATVSLSCSVSDGAAGGCLPGIDAATR
ncbi:hypothetical protein [Bradyrhizobium liaoningense]|uniref:hypothetical protein n=1 Tax=Bradyrhizobium liaoningense TaxID=43992 RepID=UPI001BA6D7A6|nr:hypothetical protein [Bradyrhizobium liaoningense]MBR0902703.1 hypothetical protein [Bradyrhizobium liaoningense]